MWVRPFVQDHAVRSFLVVLAVFVLHRGRAAETSRPVSVPVAGWRLTVDGRAAGWTCADPGFGNLVRRMRLRVFDGKARRELPVAPAVVRTRNGDVEVFRRWPDPGVEMVLHLRRVRRCLLWDIRLRAVGKKEVWLEIGLEFGLNPEVVADASLFDGLEEHGPPLADDIRVDRLRTMCPLAVVWTARGAAAAGPAPFALPSYLRHQFTRKPVPELASITRLVVRPGRPERTGFVAVPAPGEWGKAEAYEALYDSFPEWFRPTPGIDPRLWLPPAEYRAYPCRQWSPEICRRLYAGWEWCYAPFRRTGDIVGRPEFWDYEPARPFSKLRGMSRAEFLDWRRRAFHRGDRRCNVAMLFYIPSQVWCEERLAKERYPDALTTDPDVTTYFGRPWVTHHDNEMRVFPYGTSFGRRSREDIQTVVRDLDLTGLAFDTADGTAKYRGPALPHLNHCAWDEHGAWCGENVAVALLMDYVHALKNRGRPVAIAANIGGGVYTSCLHCDVAMYEGEPWKGCRTAADPLRWKMGRKPCVWWEGYGLDKFIDVESATREKVVAVYRGLADFTLLQSLRLGFYPPPNYTQGVRRLVFWLPALIDCIRTGWEPVSGVRVPEPLWVTRYGRGPGALLATAHETGRDVRTEIEVDNRRAADSSGPGGVLAFAPYHGGRLSNRFVWKKEKVYTRISLDVPVRTPRLLQAMCEIRGRKLPAMAEIEFARSLLETRMVVHFPSVEEPLRFRFFAPGILCPVSVRLDGREVRMSGKSGAVTGTGTVYDLAAPPSVEARERTITVRFTDPVFRCSEEDLCSFPFVGNGKPACRIVMAGVPEGDERVRLAAWRVQEYFRYWYGRVQTPPHEVLIPAGAESGGAHPDGRIVHLAVVPGDPPSVVIRGGSLWIQGPSSEALDAVVLRLLRVLDRKYDSPDLLPPTALNRRVGLAGAVIEPKDGRLP